MMQIERRPLGRRAAAGRRDGRCAGHGDGRGVGRRRRGGGRVGSGGVAFSGLAAGHLPDLILLGDGDEREAVGGRKELRMKGAKRGVNRRRT